MMRPLQTEPGGRCVLALPRKCLRHAQVVSGWLSSFTEQVRCRTKSASRGALHCLIRSCVAHELYSLPEQRARLYVAWRRVFQPETPAFQAVDELPAALVQAQVLGRNRISTKRLDLVLLHSQVAPVNRGRTSLDFR